MQDKISQLSLVTKSMNMIIKWYKNNEMTARNLIEYRLQELPIHISNIKGYYVLWVTNYTILC